MNMPRMVFQAPGSPLKALRIWPMLLSDVPAVLMSEQAGSEFPWSSEDFVWHIDDRDSVCLVAAAGDLVLGFLVYHFAPKWIEVLNVAVNPAWRRRGVGMQLVACSLVPSLATAALRSPLKLASARAYVRESNLSAQMFFRAQGFRTDKVLRRYYDAMDEDAFRMILRPRRQGDLPRPGRHGGGGEDD